MRRKRRLKSYVIKSLYVVLFLTIAVGGFMISKSMKKIPAVEENYTYVSSIITDQDIAVINETTKMIKPVVNEKITIGKSFYDYKADSKQQENSIIYYDGSYIQNSGIDYVLEEVFDVVSVLDGTVTDVREDELLGKVVEIKHNNGYVTSYQSLSEVSVKKDDTVTQGQTIGRSGTNKLDKDMGNHLHFELYANGQVADPNLYIDKEIKTKE
ncbi:MAG: M23 family metallopeptidase [Bacilli bacterium]|nr:M23 family metallopeptidase [Bacilli bacterium]